VLLITEEKEMGKEINKLLDKILSDPTIKQGLDVNPDMLGREIKPMINKQKMEDSEVFRKYIVEGFSKFMEECGGDEEKMKKFIHDAAISTENPERRIRRILRKAHLLNWLTD
jgi:hypothetical protein